MAQHSDRYLPLVAALVGGPKTRAEIAVALNTPPRHDGHNVIVLRRHCVPHLDQYGVRLPTLFVEIPPLPDRPASKKNVTRWKLTPAGNRLAKKLAANKGDA